jgi:transposase
MQKEYTEQEKREALRLASEIGPRPAGERLGIPCNTIYGWQGKARKRKAHVDSVVAERGVDDLVAENEKLKRDLAERATEVEILQDALGFFARRQKK